MKENHFLIMLLALLAFGSTDRAQQDEWPKIWYSNNTICTLTADSIFTVSPAANTDGTMAD